MKKVFKAFLKLSLLLVIVGITVGAVLVIDAASLKLDNKKLEGSIYDIKFFDKDNNEITQTDILFAKKPAQQLPPHVYNAFIAIEDKRFYTHKGIDVKRMFKAALTNIQSMSFKEGASTISQQLIKNTQLSSQKDIFRKSREIKLALNLEKNYTKQQILDMYLNIIYFGSGCYGIENASLYYFNKPSYNLTVNESAMLAAIIKAPNYYSPFANYEKVLARKNTVLRKMFENKLINDSEYYENINKDIVLCKSQYLLNPYNDYIKECLNEVSGILNVSLKEIKSLNYNIYTYMDAPIQNNLYNTLINNAYYNDYENTDSAAIILNNTDFTVSALSLKSMLSFDKIIRQPGSAIKPVLVYAPALEYNLLTPSTEILDEKTDFGGYSPSNYNDKYHGYTDAKFCLAKSLNVPAVKVFNSVGIDKAKLFASRCGINFTAQDNNLSLALGGFNKGISLKELAASYTPFARGGLYKKPQLIKMISDEKGKILYNDNSQPQKIMRDDTAYLISDMLKYSITKGTASKLNCLNLPLHSKTGTVGNEKFNTDAYNISYTAENTFAVWMGGLTDKKLNLKVSGGTYPTIMIKDIIENQYKDCRPAEIEKPASITECEIDIENLKRNHNLRLATDMTPEKYIKKALFSVHCMPREYSDCFTEPYIDNSEIYYEDKKIIIKFTAKDYLYYDVLRLENKGEKVITTITGKEGEVEITDNAISYGKTYQYCIIPQFINKKLNKTIKGKIYMSDKIVVPYKFSPDDGYSFDDYDDEFWWENDDITEYDID